MHAPAHRFHIDVFYCRHIIPVCDSPAQFMEKIFSLVPDFLMAQCDTVSLPEIIPAAFHTATIDRWKKILEIKEQFENQIGCSIYSLLPGIVENSFR